MENSALTHILIQIGLTENEARTYLGALSLGEASILQIARAAELKRSTVYSVMESLQHKGLIRVEYKGIKRRFVAEHPEKIEGILEAKKAQFKKVLPEFAALYNMEGTENFIKYYEGLPAVKMVYEQLLQDINPKEDYLVIGNQESWLKLDEKFFNRFVERRAKLPIKIRMLFTESPIAHRFKKFERNFNAQIKVLPEGIHFSQDMIIIPKRIVFHQLVPPVFALVVENQSIIQMHRELFEFMWGTMR